MSTSMPTTRLEAFSDGVFAVIITIMVIELKVPQSGNLAALLDLAPLLLSYLLSFVYIAIFWNNHHHLLHAVQHVSGGVLWSNMYLLFWVSLIPFTTAWIGESNFAKAPMAVYGFVLLMAAIGYHMLQHLLIRLHGPSSPLAIAVGGDRKGLFSLILYGVGIALSWWEPLAAAACYVAVTILWLIPDRRIAKAIESSPTE